MKKFLSFITAMVMIFCLMPPPITADAALSITYYEYNTDGSYTAKTLKEGEYINYLEFSDKESLKSGTYFVPGNYDPRGLTIKGNVNLIIPVGVTLNVYSGSITIMPDDNSPETPTLNIYGAGTLRTRDGIKADYGVKINMHGASFISDVSTCVNELNVYAGKVMADWGIDVGTLNVYGGTVEAESDNNSAINVINNFAVGKNGSVSGYSANGTAFSKMPTVNYDAGYDTIVRYGDSIDSYTEAVNPSGDDLAAYKYVSISKGKSDVDYIDRTYDEATGTVTDTPSSADAVSINSFSRQTTLTGWYYVDGNVDLKNRPVVEGTARIILTDGNTLNAQRGIDVPEGSTLEIYSQTGETGTITGSLANCGFNSASFIGGSSGEKCGTLKLFGGNIKASDPTFYQYFIGNGGGATGDAGEVYIYGGSIAAETAGLIIAPKLWIYGGEINAFNNNGNALKSVPTFGKSYIPTVKYGESAENAKKAVSPKDTGIYTSNKYISITNTGKETVSYVERSWDSANSTVVSENKSASAIVIDKDNPMNDLTGGWYAVKDDVTILDRIEINGNVNIILTDGCKLAVSGIHLTDGNTLNIYAQSEGSGELQAAIASDTAIGGNRNESCGTLNIHGGIISALSSQSEVSVGGNKAVIKVFGGELNAANTDNVTTIGGEGSELYVYGGKINANSFQGSAIGVGASGKIVICGGSVTASAYDDGAYAFDCAPTYDGGYIPKVMYGTSDNNTSTAVSPADTVYTSNKYVAIKNALDSFDIYQYCDRSWDGTKVVSSIKSAQCVTLEGNSNLNQLKSGWYAVKGDVTVSNRIEIHGKVNLILLDGCNLSAEKGILLPENSTLNIYGQSGGTGKLAATADMFNSTGIGGNRAGGCGTLNIFGGEVNAASTGTSGA